MCQHNLPCSIVLPTACFPEGPSPHFTFCSFWRRRPRLEAVFLGSLKFEYVLGMPDIPYILGERVDAGSNAKPRYLENLKVSKIWSGILTT